jgi:hypothetical protein
MQAQADLHGEWTTEVFDRIQERLQDEVSSRAPGTITRRLRVRVWVGGCACGFVNGLNPNTPTLSRVGSWTQRKRGSILSFCLANPDLCAPS